MTEAMKEAQAKLVIALKLAAEVKEVVVLGEGQDSCVCLLVSLATAALGSSINAMGEVKC
jgi:hypothetical protein